MEIEIQGNKVRIKPEAFTMQSDLWLWDERLTDGDRVKLMRLYWRYDFFRSKNKGENVSATNYMYLTQDAYSELLSIPRNKVSSLFKKLEECNHIVRIKSGTKKTINGVLENVPRDYVVVLNPSHPDYTKELNDVWFVLSKRLNSLEDQCRTDNKTYIHMTTSYTRLFGEKSRYVELPKEENEGEFNFGEVSNIKIDNVPEYSLPPLSSYEGCFNEHYEDYEYDTTDNKDYSTFCDWELEEPPF